MTLVLRGWGFRYPGQERWALDGVDLTLPPGEVTWVTGAAGSGSSTLLLSLAGLAPRVTGGDAQGEVTHDGHPDLAISPLERGIGYLGPSPALQLSGIARTVRDELAIGSMNLNRPVAEIRLAVDMALERLHIEHLAARAPGTLSGGETQRVLLACITASQPDVWLLDEPFSALDRASVAHTQELLRDLAQQGATIAVACDNADTMAGTAHRLVVLREGRVALDGAPQHLLAGDDLVAAGAGTTDAATLARMIGMPAPRPLTGHDLVQQVAGRATTPGASSSSPPKSPGKSVLRFEKVDFAYRGGASVLRDINLAVGAGEAVGIFGANGAGKSTLLRLAMALEHPTSGAVTTLGRPTRLQYPEDFAPIAGFLFQQAERQLFATSVRAECALAPTLAGWDRSRVDSAVDRTLDQLGLADTSHEHPYDLPLPTRRLVALAAILAADPVLVLLDEPTAGLDAAARERVIAAVRSRVAAGSAVVAITHDPLFAHEALDRGVLLQSGRIVHDGAVRDMLDGRVMQRTAAMAVAIALGLAPGHDRRADVVQQLRR